MRTHVSSDGKPWEGYSAGVCWQDNRPVDKLRPMAESTEFFCYPVIQLDDVLQQESHVTGLFGIPLVLMRRLSQFPMVSRQYVNDEHTGFGPTNPTAILLAKPSSGFPSDE